MKPCIVCGHFCSQNPTSIPLGSPLDPLGSRTAKNRNWDDCYHEPVHTTHIYLFRFVALRPKSTAMVMAGRSVHLNTLFTRKLEQAVNQYFMHILLLLTDKNPS